jgi:hypothetical protein
MISAILAILGSSTVGSLLGGIFALLNRKADREAKLVDNQHELAMAQHQLALREKDLEIAKQEAQGRKEVAIIETDGIVEAERMKAIAATQLADQISPAELKAAGGMRPLLVFAAASNRLIRPLATVLLAGSAIYINHLLLQYFTANWSQLTTAQQFEISMQAFAWLTGQASAVLGYWFVSRGTSVK